MTLRIIVTFCQELSIAWCQRDLIWKQSPLFDSSTHTITNYPKKYSYYLLSHVYSQKARISLKIIISFFSRFNPSSKFSINPVALQSMNLKRVDSCLVGPINTKKGNKKNCISCVPSCLNSYWETPRGFIFCLESERYFHLGQPTARTQQWLTA